MTTAGNAPRLLLFTGDDALGDHLAGALGEDARRATSFEGLEEQCKGTGPWTLAYVAASRGAARVPRGDVRPDLDDLERFAEALKGLLTKESVCHLVVVSSAAVWEPTHHHLAMTREVPIGRRRTSNEIPVLWERLETRSYELARELGTVLTILRPAHLVVPGGTDFWSKLFRRRLAATLPGYDPVLQLLAPRDLALALRRVAETSPKTTPEPGAVDVLHVAPSHTLHLRKALWTAGVLRLPIPAFLQALVRFLLRPLGAATMDQVAYLRHANTVSAESIEALGFRASTSSARAARETRDPEVRAAEIDTRPQDPYGLDIAYVRRLSATLFRFLHDVWWRVAVRDGDFVPKDGPAVLVGVHRGFQPWDGVMAMDYVARTTGRYVRFLTHPTLIKFPFIAPYMIKMGGIPAAREPAHWVLSQGGLLAVFPEGIRGAFKSYGPGVYELSRFNAEFARFAVEHEAPVVPFVTVGAAEIYPILGKLDWGWWKRNAEWPCFPLTPNLGTVPLPSKWHTRYLPPVRFEHPPDAASDSALVRRLARQVKQAMAGAMADLVARRRHIFWGDLRPPTEPEPAERAVEQSP